MKIIALGNCCKKSIKNYENAITAAKNCNISDPVENIGDIKEIMNYGVMATPALVIDGIVVSMGKVASVEKIEEYINKAKSN